MVKTLTDSNFTAELEQTSGLYLVDFWASWCGPCLMMGPVIETMAEKFAGKLTVGKLNVNENPLTAMQYRVASIPLLLFFRNGKVVHSLLGAQPQSYLEQTIQYLLGD